MAAIAFAAAAFFTVGLVLRRWGLVALPVAGWPLAYFGSTQGWCCNGLVGADLWFVAAIALASGGAAAVGVVLGRRWWGRIQDDSPQST